MTVKSHQNNFGALRLFFASLVIIAHSPEIIDGNRSREFLTRIFGTITLGDVAVDCFLLVSGFLVLKSYQNSLTIKDYAMKRVLRIYPGYIAAFTFCVLIIGPLVGGNVATIFGVGGIGQIVRGFGLATPALPGAFQGLPYPFLNIPMWTISYEFRCYLLVIGFGIAGGFQHRWVLVIIAAMLFAIMFVFNEIHAPSLPQSVLHVIGEPYRTIRLTAMFSTGSLFYLFRDQIRYRSGYALVAGFALVPLMFWSQLAHQAVAIFGGYLVFWVALHVRSNFLSRINNREDISYGVYLYAWPVQSTILYFEREISPMLMTLVTIPIVVLLGLVSWRLIEKPFQALKSPARRSISAPSLN